ncbi:hypothetical protein GGR53DRAFT_466250 [Hypoxylon sp. FL1150]|nr:hypothetical protein GGR53DRAFT_466250 [Hypoxylon sp. FL1150]
MLATLPTFTILTSAAFAASIPHERSLQPRVSYSDYHDLKTFNSTDATQMCTSQYNTEEEALRIWWGTGADNQLDSFITTRGEANWFDMMTSFVFNAAGDMDCTTLTGAGNCEISADKCTDLVKEGKGTFYWILKAVSIFHDITANLYQAYVQSSAISDGLRIDELTSDFDVTAPAPSHVPNIFSMIAAALTIGSALSGIAGLTIGPFFSLLGGILAETAQLKSTDSETTTQSTLGTIIADFFDKMEDTLQSLLLNALGKGNATALPAQSLTESSYDKNPTAQYFADGKFLVMDVGATMAPAIDQGKILLRQSLAFDTLGQQGWWVQVYMDAMDQSTCANYQNGTQGTHGDTNVRWLADTKRCATLAKKSMPYEEYYQAAIKGVSGAKTRAMPTNLNPNKTELLASKYGVDLTPVYENSIDCALHGTNGMVETESLPSSKSMARCFFHMPVKTGYYQGQDGYYYWTNYNISTGQMLSD